jgi:hypothetical protein
MRRHGHVLLEIMIVVSLLLGAASAEWTQEQCETGIGNIATEARKCQEQAAGAGRDISGELIQGDPACSEVRAPLLSLLRGRGCR